MNAMGSNSGASIGSSDGHTSLSVASSCLENRGTACSAASSAALLAALARSTIAADEGEGGPAPAPLPDDGLGDSEGDAEGEGEAATLEPEDTLMAMAGLASLRTMPLQSLLPLCRLLQSQSRDAEAGADVSLSQARAAAIV